MFLLFLLHNGLLHIKRSDAIYLVLFSTSKEPFLKIKLTTQMLLPQASQMQCRLVLIVGNTLKIFQEKRSYLDLAYFFLYIRKECLWERHEAIFTYALFRQTTFLGSTRDMMQYATQIIDRSSFLSYPSMSYHHIRLKHCFPYNHQVK